MDYLDTLLDNDLSTTKKKKVTKLVSAKKTEVENASTIEEVEAIKIATNDEYQDIINEVENTTTCQFASVVTLRIISTFVLMASVVLVLRKKH